MDTFNAFIYVLNRFQLKEGVQDSWRWRDSPGGYYTTKDSCNALRAALGPNQMEERREKCFKLIWNKIEPLKVIAHAWRVLWDRLPTKSNLRRRNIIGPNESSRCVLCDEAEESGRHIFFECKVSHEIWMRCYKWLGISTVLHSRSFSNLFAHIRIFRVKKDTNLSMAIWLCVVWLIWKGMNALILEGAVFSIDKTVEELKARLWSWCYVKCIGFSGFSFNDWNVNPRMVLGC